MTRRGTTAWTLGAAVALAALYLAIAHTRLGIALAFRLEGGALDPVCVGLLRYVDAANPRNQVGLVACRALAVEAVSGLAQRRPTPAEAIRATDRYLSRMRRIGIPSRTAEAWCLRAEVSSLMGRNAEAAHVLEQGLSGHWSEPWADLYSAFQIGYLGMAGRRREALTAFDEFVADHADGDPTACWQAAEDILRAFPRDQIGWIRRYLGGVRASHSHTALAKAIGQVLAIPARQVPPYTQTGPNYPGPMPP